MSAGARGPILPGATIGILGGGQLGRMIAIAARAMGYKIRALDPDPRCAIRPLADELIIAPFNDTASAVRLAQQCAVLTIDNERISIHSLEECARYVPVRPSARVLSLVQDRASQKSWLARHGYPLGPWKSAASFEPLRAAVAGFGFDSYLKACRGGYDGHAQARIRCEADVAAAWDTLGPQAYVVEQALDLEAELSVLVARRHSGEMIAYPPALNHHEDRILRWSVIPAPVSRDIAHETCALAVDIADSLALEGLLVVEMFMDKHRGLLVNELAPRPHNSYHASERACMTSQFEQAVRALCDLPLGSADIMRPVAIANLLGDLWSEGAAPPFEKALALPGVHLHIYDKHPPRARRKMGHLSAGAETPEQAIEKILEGMRLLLENGTRS
jgi:5-(carboxyamino)imidazole ribonucleotide synthase